MRLKLIVLAMASSMAMGSALAQTDTQELRTDFVSDAERSMYMDNREMMAPFFTDGTMSTMTSEAEVDATFAAMGADDQASMKKACERATEDRGSYGTVTAGLCARVMAM